MHEIRLVNKSQSILHILELKRALEESEETLKGA